MSAKSGELVVRVQFNALLVALTRYGMWDAARALWDWGEEWLDVEEEDMDELIQEELDAGHFDP